MDFQKSILQNGLRRILIPYKGSLTTTVLVLVEAGSKYETKDINGVSHFLEHMAFKGTKKRPTAYSISKELDGIGAHYNAFTGQEWTGYFIKAANQYQDVILDVVSDIYSNSLFDAVELEKEKGVIIEEINMYEDLPPKKISDLFLELLYGDQPAGWSVAGEKEIIKSLARASVENYHNKHYSAAKTIVVLAGDFEISDMTEKVAKYFDAISIGEYVDKKPVIETQAAPKFLVKNKKVDQAHLLLGVRAFDIHDPRRYAIQILSDYLGGGMSSKLFQKIREELGAAYYINSEIELSSDSGFLAVSAGIDFNKLDIVVEAILNEMRFVAEGKFTENDLKQAQDHLIGSFLISLETSDDLATFYGGQEIQLKKLEKPEDIINKISSATRADVIKVAKDVFKNERLNLAAIVPEGLNTDFGGLLKF